MNTEKSYFHVCPLPLETGSIILPGNWGRIIRSYVNSNVNQNMLWIMFREQTFESVRRTKFPEKPSRFDSTFLFDNLDRAIEFKRQNNRLFDLIYKVEIKEPEKPVHIACMNLVNISEGARFFDALEANATKYWESAEMTFPEIITMSAIRVTEKIDNT